MRPLQPAQKPKHGERASGFSVSLRVKAMASTLIVVVSMSAVLGFMVEKIAFDSAAQSQIARIEFTLNQMAVENSDAFVAPVDADEIAQCLNKAVEAPGAVFAAAYDDGGQVIASVRRSGYVGNLRRHLSEFGRHGDPDVFDPIQGSTGILLEERRVYDSSAQGSPAGAPTGSVLIGHTLTPVEERFGVVRRKIWCVIALVSAVAALLAWLASQSLVGPIHELIAGTVRIARGEHTYVEVKTRDELRHLADSFNSMSRDLRKSRSQLAEQNRTLEDTVRQRTRKLSEAYQELQVLDKMKDGFLSSISHEFRTPLTSIRAFTEILLDPEFDGTDRDEFLRIVLKEAERLEGLVNDVMDLAKMESGEMTFRFSPTSPDKPLRSALESVQELAATRQVEFDVELPDRLPDARWDYAKVTRVLHELLENSIRFAPSGSTVEIEMKDLGNRARFSFRDYGPGIPADSLESVFQKFRQVGEGITDKPEGAGLGLPICRKIAEQHGGSVHAELPDGVGARVVLVLPYAPPLPPVSSTHKDFVQEATSPITSSS